MSDTPLRLGTRGSALARWQADWVTTALRNRGVAVEQVLITTRGDATSGPLGAIGGQGLFTKEIQRALLDGRVDIAVHSLKDLPTEAVAGLELAATPPRENPGDALVSNDFPNWSELPQGARLGTGSARRKAQLLHARPDLEVLDIRGNVDTRLAKLDAGEYDAIVLAEAGLRRLQLHERINQVLPRELILPAVGQGALGIETRADDQAVRAAVQPLSDSATLAAVTAERALLAGLRGGCLAPVGAWGRIEAGRLVLDAVVLDSQGRQRIQESGTGEAGHAARLGREVAERLLARGAADLISQSRSPRD